MPERGREDRSGNGVERQAEQEEFKVEDRRHWQSDDEAETPKSEDEQAKDDAGAEPIKPTLLDEFKQRAEAAEAKLQKYIDAYKADQEEQERFRARLQRDVERKVELQFGELVADLLMSADDLDLALNHVSGNPDAKPLAEGVEMARNRFLGTLEKHGVYKVEPDGEEFDPNEAEAMRVDPVDTPDLNGKVTETLQPGYRLGDRIIRPARVAVGRHSS